MKTASFRTYTGPGRISIARSARMVRGGFRLYRRLAPGAWFKTVDKAEYERLYQEVLSRLDAQQVWDELHRLAAGAEPVLMCWETPPFNGSNFCHRRMVAEWLERELGVSVPEMAAAA